MRMQIKGAGSVVPGEVIAGGALYEEGAAGEQRRPAGRSSGGSYKYTTLDVHIIIITAALLLLLLCILLLHFLIRWALRRLFPLPSIKPNTPHKGLTPLQVQALPTFIYPCPYILAPHTFGPHMKPTLPYHPNGHEALLCTPSPIFGPRSNVHMEKGTKIDEALANNHTNGDEVLWGTPSSIFASPSNVDVEKSTKVDDALANHNAGNVHVANGPTLTLGCTKVDEVANHVEVAMGAPLTIGWYKIEEVSNHDEINASSLSPNEMDEVVKGDSSIDVYAKPNEVADHAKLNASSATPIIDYIDSTKVNEVVAHSELNASSPNPCPICLVDFTNGDTIRVLPACQHYFHVRCVDMWLEKKSSCPACRANLIEATKTSTNKLATQIQLAITTSH